MSEINGSELSLSNIFTLFISVNNIYSLNIKTVVKVGCCDRMKGILITFSSM